MSEFVKRNLFKACYMGNVDMVKELASAENVNAMDKEGFTPIQIAMKGLVSLGGSHNYITIAMILMDYGADPFKSENPDHVPAIRITPDKAENLEKYYKELYATGTLQKIITTTEVWNYILEERKKLNDNDFKYTKTFKDISQLFHYWNTYSKEK